MDKCNICPRKCNVDRKNGKKGVCGVAGSGINVTRAALHYWEEPCISGEEGSGTIFFAGCNLKCVYCQNYEISRGIAGKEITVERLAEICLELQKKGANNINLVTPTHYVPQIVEALKCAKNSGLTIPIVYNTSGYEDVSVLRELEGIVDIYLTDFKYMNEETALRYSKAEDYPEVAKKAVEEMHRQINENLFDERGIMKKGIIIRYLLLPGCLEEGKDIIKYLYSRYTDDVFLSLMNQYTPKNVSDYPEIDRKVTDEEYDELVDYAIELGVENGFIQEGETASESFIPAFDGEGI